MIISHPVPKTYSKKIITVECDYQTSEKCKKCYELPMASATAIMSKNEGKIICKQCSMKDKVNRINRLNTPYDDINDNFFKKIDSEEKAYLLGWIASDGTINQAGFCINIHQKDIKTLNKIKNLISPKSKIVKTNYLSADKLTKRKMCYFCISRKEISKDLCKLFNISPGKKSDIIEFPKIEDKFKFAFIRGYFDGDGYVSNPRNSHTYPECSISSNSKAMLESIKEFINIPCGIYKNELKISGVNALDFLGKLYGDTNLFLDRKKELYDLWSVWLPGIYGSQLDKFKFIKINNHAVIPSKSRVSDSGYDITLTSKIESYGNVVLYGTGLRVQPAFGYYLMLVPRSSIIKKGYMLANGVGILDRSYVGEIKVALIKTDPNAPDLELPCKIMQLIPKLIQHFEVVEVDSFDDTSRGDGGFGSTNLTKGATNGRIEFS